MGGNIVALAKSALRRAFGGESDARGYAATPDANLVEGVEIGDVESDLSRGDGNELRTKFRAVHSSAALAVNAFGIFKRRPSDFVLLGMRGAERVEFEKPFRIFRGGRAPNMDVWIQRAERPIAIESKLLEYLKPKRAVFSSAYQRLAGKCDPAWWAAYEQACDGTSLHLDRAQLLKHYFGLNAYRQKSPDAFPTLVYLFWEPLNWSQLEACVQHRAELADFTDSLSSADIQFEWMTYSDLWNEWTAVPALAGHAAMLRSRYEVVVPAL